MNYETPKSQHGERFVRVKAKLKTWTIIEREIEYDTYSNAWIIPAGYQLDTDVIEWEYINNNND